MVKCFVMVLAHEKLLRLNYVSLCYLQLSWLNAERVSMKLTSFHEKRLVGSIVLSQKIFLQDSICMPMVGGQFCTCHNDHPFKGLFRLVFEIV
ncbi:hypothetical protein GQ457_15G024060 [Hibiscus cannabinus]